MMTAKAEFSIAEEIEQILHIFKGFEKRSLLLLN